jgi:cysteinyl-tRNA synthetase, unknown class
MTETPPTSSPATSSPATAAVASAVAAGSTTQGAPTHGLPAAATTGGSLLIRTVLGLSLLTALVAGSAWLLHATSDPGNAFAADPDAAERRALIAGVKSWSFETSAADPVAVRSGLGDLVVIDHNAISTERRTADRKSLEALQRKPNGGRRLVLAYVSLTEAEQRRAYWQTEWLATGTGAAKRPGWLLEESPERRGNWHVNIANPSWHGILYGAEDSVVDRILAAGFDGVYLDTGGLLDRGSGPNRTEAARSETEWQLSELVSRITTHARLQHPRFVVMLEEAELLIDRTPVASAIDIAAKHDLLFGRIAVGRANRPADIAATVKDLTRVATAKRPVFVVEHLVDPALAVAARARIRELGYVAAISTAAKDSVNLATPAVD